MATDFNAGVQERTLATAIEAPVEGRTLSGYAIRWNEWTPIGGGAYMERFAPGSWGDSQPKVIHEHGMDPGIGMRPIASLRSLVDDGTGEAYEADLLDVPYVEALLPALRAGLFGASFRFQALDQQLNRRPGKSQHNPDGVPEVTVTRAKVVEISSTTFPAYAGSTASVRSIDVTPVAKPVKALQPARSQAANYQHKDWFIS